MLFALVALLVFRQARMVDWPAVWAALRALPTSVLVVAGAFALSSHIVYGTFDWIGRHCSGHRVGWGATFGIAMTSYPFTLNMGSLIGGVAVRFRLYSRRGLKPGTIGQVVTTSILTNWSGYFLLAAALPWMWQPPTLGGWSGAYWRAAAALLGCLPLTYVIICALREGRAISFRGRSFPLPRWPVALWQIVVSSGNWMLMAAALWALLQGQASYPASLACVMLGAVAGLVLRVPAGLGVLEAVGVALLATPELGPAKVLAALLAYRALYYFAPLVAALPALGAAEWHWRHTGAAGERRTAQA